MISFTFHDAILVLGYIVEVHTGTEPGGDTEANVHLKLDGQRGDTGVRKLLKSLSPPPEDGSPPPAMFSLGKVM